MTDQSHANTGADSPMLMRGDEDALDGLRELMRSAAANAPEIKELGYCSQLAHNTLKKEISFRPLREKFIKINKQAR